jgi:hypothetical protein
MPRATRTLSGASLEKYLRELFAAVPELTEDATRRLTAQICDEVSHLRVRLPIPMRGSPANVPAATAEAGSKQPTPADEARASSTPVVGGAEPAPAGPEPASAGDTSPIAQQPASTEPQEPPFDPYAFSLVAVFKRNGRKALLTRLGQISSPEHLLKLAEAQHITLPAGIARPAELRKAIVEGTEQRLADRQAAAT